jgi:hypothetical protein
LIMDMISENRKSKCSRAAEEKGGRVKQNKE